MGYPDYHLHHERDPADEAGLSAHLQGAAADAAADAATIVLPAILPEVMSGTRLGFSLTLLGVLIGEMFASRRGLGFLITNAIGLGDIAPSWRSRAAGGLRGRGQRRAPRLLRALHR